MLNKSSKESICNPLSPFQMSNQTAKFDGSELIVVG